MHEKIKDTLIGAGILTAATTVIYGLGLIGVEIVYRPNYSLTFTDFLWVFLSGLWILGGGCLVAMTAYWTLQISARVGGFVRRCWRGWSRS